MDTQTERNRTHNYAKYYSTVLYYTLATILHFILVLCGSSYVCGFCGKIPQNF